MKYINILTPLLRVLGVDPQAFNALYKTKIKMDFRRKAGGFRMGSQNLSFVAQLFFYAFIGLLPLLFLLLIPNIMLGYTLFFTLLMFFCGSGAIVDFSATLFDEKENHILLPLPLSARTLLFTRVMHILTFISMQMYAFSIPIIIFMAVKGPVNLPLLIVAIFLTVWFTLLLTIGFYLLIARLVSAELFKDIINYVQIALVILTVIATQLIPRMLGVDRFAEIAMEMNWRTFILPPLWFAGFSLFFQSDMLWRDTILFMMALTSGLAGGLLVVRLLSGHFNQVLGHFSVGSTRRLLAGRQKKKAISLLSAAASILCVSTAEKEGWHLADTISKRDRKFKLQMYPGLAFAFILMIIFFFSKSGFKIDSNELAASQKYLALILCGAMALIGVDLTVFTNNPEAAWIYQLAQEKNINQIESGAVKLMLFKFFVPVLCLFLGITFYIWGPKALLHLITGLVLYVAFTVFIVASRQKIYPYSQDYTLLNKSTYKTNNILKFLVIGAITGLVYWISHMHAGYCTGLCGLGLASLKYSFVKQRMKERLAINTY